ncbi:hypothetical protein [Burkholderia sp. LMG 13014]|uniref:hypothetical protein n=1 Tax=Burkholderia sp. LMG 13014 TaxID=2709306 RepID=UPI001965C299|nr:hypothetical protein [Burkholderia sp. LMG 13014]
METINEFIDKKENEDIKEALRSSLARMTALLPKANEDILIHTLSMLDKEERDRWVEYIQREELINNKPALIGMYGLIVSNKTIGDAAIAAQAAENILLKTVPGVVNQQLTAFKNTIMDMQVDCVVEMENSLVPLRDVFNKLDEKLEETKEVGKNLENFAADTFKIVETAYAERTKHLDARIDAGKEALTTHANNEIVRISKEIDNKAKEVELVLTEKAVREFRKAIVPTITKAIGWKGLLSAVAVVTASMFLHDFVLRLFH